MKVGIIGAGPCGLASIKSCLEYGLEPVAFEKTNDIGGLWNYTDDPKVPSVMKSTIINTSKEMTAFSDFPPPKDAPNFMPHKDILKYFRSYAEHFKLLPHIRLNTEVISVRKSNDHTTSKQWFIQYKSSRAADTEVREMTVDGVMVCTGHHSDPYIPTFPGQDIFQGKIIHSVEYKSPYEYVGKNVMVVGVGNSGGDISVELSRNATAEKTYLSTRRGAWVIGRVGPRGLPGDIVYGNRLVAWMGKTFPNYVNSKLEAACNSFMDHERFGLKPKHKPRSQHGFNQDDMPNRLLSGLLTIKPDIKCFTENGCIFEDGSLVPLDAVILSTGFNITFPYLESGALGNMDDNQTRLFKYMYPPETEHPETIAAIGCVQPAGATITVGEMQSRIFCAVLTGETQLPTRAAMITDILEKQEAIRERFGTRRRYTLEVDYVPFMDELAQFLGVYPSPMDYVTSDHTLAYQLVTGPMAAYAYRLKGPHSWSEARTVFTSVMERVWAPTCPKTLTNGGEGCCGWLKSYQLILIIVLIMVLVYFSVFY